MFFFRRQRIIEMVTVTTSTIPPMTPARMISIGRFSAGAKKEWQREIKKKKTSLQECLMRIRSSSLATPRDIGQLGLAALCGLNEKKMAQIIPEGPIFIDNIFIVAPDME